MFEQRRREPGAGGALRDQWFLARAEAVGSSRLPPLALALVLALRTAMRPPPPRIRTCRDTGTDAFATPSAGSSAPARGRLAVAALADRRGRRRPRRPVADHGRPAGWSPHGLRRTGLRATARCPVTPVGAIESGSRPPQAARPSPAPAEGAVHHRPDRANSLWPARRHRTSRAGVGRCPNRCPLDGARHGNGNGASPVR